MVSGNGQKLFQPTPEEVKAELDKRLKELDILKCCFAWTQSIMAINLQPRSKDIHDHITARSIEAFMKWTLSGFCPVCGKTIRRKEAERGTPEKHPESDTTGPS